MGLTGRHTQQRKIHGLEITSAQLRVLRAWRGYSSRTKYAPTGVELARLSGAAESQISDWLLKWEQDELIVRGKGMRTMFLTQKAFDLMTALDELDNIWSSYFDKRANVIREFGVSDSYETPDTDLQRKNPRYEERDSDTSQRRFSRNL